jgi:hypothetical protein
MADKQASHALQAQGPQHTHITYNYVLHTSQKLQIGAHCWYTHAGSRKQQPAAQATSSKRK